MAIPKNILKEWFSNLKKPPEEQFWGWQDAFWHKLEMIPISGIQNLFNILSKKADLVDGVVPEDQLPFSALTSEIISLGAVSVVGNKTNLAVHSSGANKVRVKGPIITRTFPNEWTITPVVADGTKVLRGYAVKGQLDFFLAEGPELPEIVDPEIPEGALELFKITMNFSGATIVVPASGNKLKEESNWNYVEINSNATPIILQQPSDTRGSFYLTKSLGVGEIPIEGIKKVSVSPDFRENYFYGGREMLLFNATGGNIIIDSSGATDADSYFFSDRITPFMLKNDSSVLVKLRGDVLELLPSGSDPDLSPYALDTDLDAEEYNRALEDFILDSKINTNTTNIANKLTKPSVSSDFLNYPSIVAVDALGNTAKVPSGGYDFLSLLFTENVKWLKPPPGSNGYTSFNAPANIVQQGHASNNNSDFPGVTYSSSSSTLGFQRSNPLRIFTGWPYKVYRQFSIDTTVSTQRIYIGYSENYRSIAPTNVAISTLTNCIAICMESGNTNLLLVHNDASGSSNIIDTGFINASKYIYGFTISQNYGDTNVYVKLDRLDSVTGATSSWTYTIASDYTNNFNHSAGIWVVDSLNIATVKVTDFGLYQTIRRNLP